jgi:AbrB family looped-hinge helix DNA binding protein
VDGIARLANAPRMLRARVDAKGRFTVPKALRLQLGLTSGSQILLQAAGEELRGIAAPALLRRRRGARQGLHRRLTRIESDRDG